jgi:2,4-dichlorophenol 6-monooxygenase
VELREIEDHGCVLVRPDRFVAYRADTLSAEPVAELRRVFSGILGRAVLAEPASTGRQTFINA